MENSNDNDAPAERSSDERNEDFDNSNYDEEELSDESGYGPELSEHMMLLQLKGNDPNVSSLYAHWNANSYVNNVDWREEGGYIGDNTHLKKAIIYVSDTSYQPNGYQIDGLVQLNFSAFCKGLVRNRSIRRLHIVGCRCMVLLMEILSPFLEQNSHLSHLVINCCSMGCSMDTDATRLLVSALSNRRSKSSLRRVELVSCAIGGTESVELIASLNQHCNLVQLCLGGNQIGLNRCVELVKLLQTSSRLKELNLDNSGIDDECIDVMISPLANNKSLRKLSLSQNEDITADGWQTFSALLKDPNSLLEALYLSKTGLDDQGAAVIGNAL